MQHDMELSGHVDKLSTANKPREFPCKNTPIMHARVVDLLVHRDELRLEELVFELWCKFDMTVSQSSVSQMLKQERLKSKVHTRIAHHHSVIKQGIYEEQLAQLMARGHEIRIDPMDMRVYLDGWAASEMAICPMVGIGGGVSSQVLTTQLVDAVLSMPEGMHERVVQYYPVKLKSAFFNGILELPSPLNLLLLCQS
jgi:hypothetical protein